MVGGVGGGAAEAEAGGGGAEATATHVYGFEHEMDSSWHGVDAGGTLLQRAGPAGVFEAAEVRQVPQSRITLLGQLGEGWARLPKALLVLLLTCWAVYLALQVGSVDGGGDNRGVSSD